MFPTEDSTSLKHVSDKVVLCPSLPDSNTNVTLQWKNMSVYVEAKENCFTGRKSVPDKEIISNVSGIAVPGTILAIMGSSGSGKTTLLNALTLRSQNHFRVEGTVLVNGSVVTPGRMDEMSAYVQQDDLFFGKLSVKEQLNFHALLRMDSTLTKQQRHKRVRKVINELGLTNCQDTLIGVPGRIQGISGGERRRLAFACEILSDPPLMFCDEPTSGLDAFMSQNVIVTLRKMAAKGKTIVCTIHQPSSYQYVLFDRIMLMAGGKLAFLGTPDEALNFFSKMQFPCPGNSSPADHFIHVLSALHEVGNGSAATKICQAFALSKEATALSENKSWKNEHLMLNGKDHKQTRSKPSIGKQLLVMLWRSWLGVIRDPKLIFVKFITVVLMAVIMGSVYWDQKDDQLGVININSFFVLFLVLIMVQNVFAVLHVFSEELPLFLREHWNGMYSTGVYVLSKSIADLPEFLIFPFFQTVIAFWMIGIARNWEEMLFACGIVILVANACASYGYFISSINSSLGGAVALVPFMIGPLITVSGFFINLRSIPWYFRWVHHISMFKYGTEALTINQWRNVNDIECNIDISTCPRNGSNVLQFLDYGTDNISTDVIANAALTVAFRLLATILLSIQAWRKH